jgi:hypothetical protein
MLQISPLFVEVQHGLGWCDKSKIAAVGYSFLFLLGLVVVKEDNEVKGLTREM